MAVEWDLAATNLSRLAQRRFDVAVLPIGATEAHNRHLPEGQDFLVAQHIARRCCAAAWEQGHSVVCLPPLPYGVDCNLLDFPLTIHVSQDTLNALVHDICVSLRHHEIRKIVLLNGHGGNAFVPLIRELQSTTDLHLFLCNWWMVGKDQYAKIFEQPDDHAGELETSVALALHPELVELRVAGDGTPRPFRFEALQKGWVQTSREFSRLNDHCGVGNPAAATAEKGHQYLDLVCQRITAFLGQLAAAEIDDTFPHE
jgi:creatinine amidohydrolase